MTPKFSSLKQQTFIISHSFWGWGESINSCSLARWLWFRVFHYSQYVSWACRHLKACLWLEDPLLRWRIQMQFQEASSPLDMDLSVGSWHGNGKQMIKRATNMEATMPSTPNSFNTFTELCNHHHNPVLKLLSSPKVTLCPFRVNTCSHSQP